MKRSKIWPTLLIFGIFFSASAENIPGTSMYTLKPNDTEAVYFTPENFNISADGKTDVSDELQQAINQLKQSKNFGIVFIPEGKYLITKTIYVPKAIRLIGYGSKRPLIFLGKKSPGYQEEVVNDKGKANYMFWFTSDIVEAGQEPRDASAGTFYSAISNINLKIEDGNPYAVALRTHFAQHSFVSHVDIQIGNGKAGLYDVGNEMENVRFYGGEYGIYTTKTSPGWQMMMVDTYFEGQSKAAIFTQEGGLTIVRLKAVNVPSVIEIRPNYSDRIFMEDCSFKNISAPALIVSNENNHTNQISLRNIVCEEVPVLVHYRRSNTQTNGKGKLYKVVNYTHGLHMSDMAAEPENKTLADIIELKKLPDSPANDIPALPDMQTWVNIKDLGALGDGVTDDTKVFLQAIEKYSAIYIPQGWYVISEPLKLKSNTNLFGLNPVATQLMLRESTPAFSGFGTPVALLETPAGGKNIVSGIGINTGGYNYRAVGCKWMAGANSYMNDVKFIGGHGSMARGTEKPWSRGDRRISTPDEPVTDQGKDKAWDNQYWSLWITNGGGGTFKDIWTASTYSANGIYVNNTSTPGRIYAMSIEHHVRNEARFKNVSNWKVYAFQTEEESREGLDCQPIELQDCSDMVFANLYMFRVIRVKTPYPYAVRTWNCKNIEFLNVHNYSQIKYTNTLTFYDINTNLDVRPWEFTKLTVTGNETRKDPLTNQPGKLEKLATGFEFIEGITRDSKGNIYFSEQRMRRIYKWDVEKNVVSMISEFPWEPMSLACDTKDNLLVLFKYNPQPGYKINGEQESVPALPDADGTSFSGWGNSGFGSWVYSIDPENPEESIALLPRVPMGSIKNIAKAFYPSNRWRDSHDFNEISVLVPENCFVAPDGVTIIPECYDLARTASLLEAIPGEPFYTADEYDTRMVKMDVDNEGRLSNLSYFVEQAEFGSAIDDEGNLYVADGHIYIYDKNGNKTGKIELPERPTSVQFGGKEGKTLFITARSSLYSYNINK
ncbi:MAG: SMP-30/gluconolactonase/LRE family protein [Bacteroidales bacterium]|nr:SMP-30/gluconolactonase/LRE family protein [Bacteroidales bacterium]MCF8389415.1 SMP-30/gluconolactonase/LRE family protein [Bacteroidales bacterium]